MKNGKKYAKEISKVKEFFVEGKFQNSVSAHTNMPDDCHVCGWDIQAGLACRKSGISHEAMDTWIDMGFVVCYNCGHVSLRANNDLIEMNPFLSIVARESWEKYLKS